MFNLLRKLFPICRSITGDGLKKSLYIVKSSLKKQDQKKFKIIKIKSGTKCYDWRFPKEWVIKDAFLLKRKKKIIDFKKNNLHVINYSHPVNLTNVPFKKVKKFLNFDKKYKNAIPYITSYYKKKIGLCLSYNKFKKLNNDKYTIKIDSKFKKGFSYLGEYSIKGKSQKEIFFSTYLCHPSMANNELSGPVLSITLAKWIKQNFKKTNYSYRFVYGPETIGAIYYISKNIKKLKKNIKYAFNLTCLAGGMTFSFLPSRLGNTLSDKASLNILKHHYKNFKTYSFLSRGSDERQYCSPKVNLPMVSVMKKKYHEYKEYHTSLDNLSFVKKTHLNHTLNFYKKLVYLIENNFYLKSNFVCEPQLNKYFSISQPGGRSIRGNLKLILDILIYSDGKLTVVDVAEILDKSAIKLLPLIKKLYKMKFISLSL